MPAHAHSAIDATIVNDSDDAQARQPESPRVLVVDDEQAVRQLLNRWLTSAGYSVTLVANAAAALDAMAQTPASIVLCDVRMPGHDGLWLAERLQAEWPSTPIVMVTGIDDLETVQESRDVGAVDYLTKPINRDQLFEVVRRVVVGSTIPTNPAAETDPDAMSAAEPPIEAEYTLETPVRCPACGERTRHLKAVRLVRARVNFTSTLPRRGRVLACPHCLAIVPGELTNF